MEELTQENLKEILDYNPNTGVFYWKVGKKTGQVCGKPNVRDYVYMHILGKAYSGHRLAWFYMTGKWPKNQIDHINRIKSDNRFQNLRDVTRSQNLMNKTKYSNNKSGFKGVSYRKPWSVSITYDGVINTLGHFENKEEAARVYDKAAIEHHGQFANLNFPRTDYD